MDNDLISREDLKKALHTFFDGKVIDEPAYILRDVFCYIDNAPTVDVKDVYQEGHYDGHLEGYTKAINEEYSCKTCRYRFYDFFSHPCTNCRRNFKLVDEIREQKNDLWKDGTPNG